MGHKAVVQPNISLMSGSGGEADVELKINPHAMTLDNEDDWTADAVTFQDSAVSILR